jgi:uncharacterized protein (DUF58 family)
MISLAGPRLVGAAVVTAVALVLAVATGRPEAAVLASPFLVTTAVGLAWGGRPSASVSVDATPERVLAEDVVEVVARVTTSRSGHRVRATVVVPPNLELVEGRPSIEDLAADGAATFSWTFRATRWGGIREVVVDATVSDRFGLYATTVSGGSLPVRVLPREEHLRSVIPPRTLRTMLGEHLSRQRGDGIEFADVRPFVPGDLARSVNWRVSARRGEMWVDERHPDRSGEVVLFLDSFTAVGLDRDDTLRRSVELARALAARHLGANDRVGLVDLGGVFRWVRAGGGALQLYRIVETLADSEIIASVVDKPLDVIPARALPSRSLVVALSPLLDPRGIATLTRMRARSLDVAVVEVGADDIVETRADRRGALAHRIWSLEREMVRGDLRRLGIGVASWRSGQPVDPVLDELLVHREAVSRWAR